MLVVSPSKQLETVLDSASIVSTTDGRDYRREITTVTFEANVTRECFEIEILNDQLDEGTESFSAEIVSVSSDSEVVIGTPDQTTISIIDDDGKMHTYVHMCFWG